MKNKWLVAISLSLVLLAGLIAAAAGCEATFSPEGVPEEIKSSLILSQQNTGIWVNGEGKVSVTPDVALLSLGVEVQAETVAEAQERARIAMDAVMEELDDHGVAGKDIQTRSFRIDPLWHWNTRGDERILEGYRVTNMVTAKIRDIDNAGTVIDAVAEAAGNYVRIDSIGFTVDDPTEYYQEIREQAMADAEDKAEQLARLADVSLGKPTFISEGSISTYAPRDYLWEGGMSAPAAAPPTSISPGETEIRLNVQVVYSIK